MSWGAVLNFAKVATAGAAAFSAYTGYKQYKDNKKAIKRSEARDAEDRKKATAVAKTELDATNRTIAFRNRETDGRTRTASGRKKRTALDYFLPKRQETGGQFEDHLQRL